MPSKTKPNFRLPAGYENEAAFLQEFRERFGNNSGADWENQEAGVEDLQFLIGNQWDTDTEAARLAADKPTLTLNRMPAFLGQIIGRRKQNETQVKIVADNGGTEKGAKVREGIVRSIQKNSRSKQAYDNAFMGASGNGIGNFQIVPEFASDDVFEQEVRVKPILDHYSVVWDRMLTDPTGKDATGVDVVDTMTWEDFNDKWPWATPADVAINQFTAVTNQVPWFTKNDVKVVDAWRMRTRRAVLALMQDGSTRDITKLENDPATIAQIAQRPDGTPYLREVMRPYAQRYKVTALDILEGPYDLQIDRVPVFRVPGWEVRIGNVSYRWGALRFLKDPQRLHNYWRSVTAEKIMRSPKSTWLAAASAVAGREATWRASANTDDPLLIWNDDSGHKPERVEPVQVEAALIEQSSVTTQDLKDISNIHEANLGMPSNEVSGKGIEARVAVSNTGIAIYEDNMTNAIEEGGRVINQLIPVIYDTARIMKILGEDGKEYLQSINNIASDGTSVDVTSGKYSVTAINGRAYATKREESADNMLGISQAMPAVMQYAADLIVEAQDWPGAEKIAARIRQSMPASVLLPDERSPEQQQQLQVQSQAGQQADAITTAKETAAIQESQSAAALNAARAQNYTVESQLRPVNTQLDSVRIASEAASREIHDNLAAIDTATRSAH